MNSFQLFFRRLKEDWKFQYRTIRTVADWTVIFYLIIPSIVIFIFIYRSWWLEIPEWILSMPLFFVFAIGYLYAWNGHLRTFVEEADKVFLIQRGNLFLNVKKWGFTYSLFQQAFKTFLLTTLILPFLVGHYEFTFIHAGLYFLFVLAMKYLIIYIKCHIRKIERKTLRLFLQALIFIFLSWFVQLAFFSWERGYHVVILFSSLIVGAISIYLYYSFIKKRSFFEHLLIIEREQKGKNIGMIYQLSFEIEKMPVSTRKKPWLFRNSKKLFKKRTAKNGFMELFIKVFIRNSTYIGSYMRIIGITGAALIVIPPLWIKAIIFVSFVFMMSIWLGTTWERITSVHLIVKKYKEADGFFRAKRIIINSMLMLSIVLVGGITVIGWGIYNSISL